MPHFLYIVRINFVFLGKFPANSLVFPGLFHYTDNELEVCVKKLIIAVVIAVSLAAVTPLFAQKKTDGKESEFYYVNITLEKIYPYRAGYIVQYRRGISQYGRVYLPSEWFDSAASKGEVILLPPGNSWPSMSVYYKNGEFSHVRLYIHRWVSHPSWGNVPQGVNLDQEFQDITDIKIKY